MGKVSISIPKVNVGTNLGGNTKISIPKFTPIRNPISIHAPSFTGGSLSIPTSSGPKMGAAKMK